MRARKKERTEKNKKETIKKIIPVVSAVSRSGMGDFKIYVFTRNQIR